MAIDRYTKFVLTLIAICLSLLTIKAFRLLPEAYAQSDQPTRVTLCDPSGTSCGDHWAQFVVVTNFPRR